MGSIKMYYRKWTEDDLQGLKSIGGLVTLYTEIDSEGNVRRELGLDETGKVIHRFPSSLFPHGQYGLFDNQKVSVSGLTLSTARDEFERLWRQADAHT